MCLDFVNTRNWENRDPKYERFNTYADLVRWNCQAGALTGVEARRFAEAAKHRPAQAQAIFEQSMALRETIYQIFSAVAQGVTPEAADLTTLNAVLSETLAHLRLVPAEEGFTWAWSDDETALERLFWPVVKSAADLLTSEHLDRVGQCAGESCGWLFLDLSRNRSRRWCDMQDCGNRAKAHRYYKRHHLSK